jgi:hypothetical protein
MQGCAGGAAPPAGYVPPVYWTCTPKACMAPKDGAACPTEGMHCGHCYGLVYDCQNGKWKQRMVAPPPAAPPRGPGPAGF